MMLGLCLWVAVARVSRQADQVHAQTAQVVVAADAEQSGVRRDGDGSAPKSLWERIRGKKEKTVGQQMGEYLRQVEKDAEREHEERLLEAELLAQRYAHLSATTDRERFAADVSNQPEGPAPAYADKSYPHAGYTWYHQPGGHNGAYPTHGYSWYKGRGAASWYKGRGAARHAGDAPTRTRPEPEQAQAQPDLRVGQRVRMTGLKRNSELNGELGDIVNVLEGGKINVQLKIRDGPTRIDGVKWTKLEDPHVALGGRRTRDGSWDLQQDGPDPSIAVRDRACRIEGTSQDALNGQVGTILELQPPKDGKPQRVYVKLQDGQVKALKAGNVVLT